MAAKVTAGSRSDPSYGLVLECDIYARNLHEARAVAAQLELALSAFQTKSASAWDQHHELRSTTLLRRP